MTDNTEESRWEAWRLKHEAEPKGVRENISAWISHLDVGMFLVPGVMVVSAIGLVITLWALGILF